MGIIIKINKVIQARWCRYRSIRGRWSENKNTVHRLSNTAPDSLPGMVGTSRAALEWRRWKRLLSDFRIYVRCDRWS